MTLTRAWPRNNYSKHLLNWELYDDERHGGRVPRGRAAAHDMFARAQCAVRLPATFLSLSVFLCLVVSPNQIIPVQRVTTRAPYDTARRRQVVSAGRLLRPRPRCRATRARARHRRSCRRRGVRRQLITKRQLCHQ